VPIISLCFFKIFRCKTLPIFVLKFYLSKYIMSSRLKILLPLVFTLFLALGIFVGNKMRIGDGVGNVFSVNYSEKEKLNDVINYISSDYVDKVDKKKLTETTIEKLLGSLDPHSSYIPPVELDAVEESMNGNFFGIGVQFRQWHDTVVVVKTIKDGPSERSGVMAGDRLVAANGISLVGLSTDSIMKVLKGPKGTKVDVSIVRHIPQTKKTISITRGVIPYESIVSSYLINDSTGYIKIDRFAATTYDEFREAMVKLNLAKLKTLIVDLQNNGGGLLTTAISLTDEFLPAGKIIVYTKGRNRKKNISFSSSEELMKGKKVIVLVNENSASASEIFSGAIQDNDRGVIVGRRTFGKGLVQEQITLPDNSAIRLTVARYYTATGRCIQKPYNKGTDEYYHEVAERFMHGEMTNADSARFSDSLVFRTPKGKIVYGGGGIMPDVFVPIDTTQNFYFYNNLQSSGVFYDFAFSYFDKNRLELLRKYPDEKSFVKNFKIDDKTMGEMFAMAAEKNIQPEGKLPKEMLREIKTSLKAQIASDLYGSNAYYMIINQLNPVYEKALLINDTLSAVDE